MKVNCITYRNDPIFRGQVEGSAPGVISESGYMYFAVLGALMRNTLEDAGIPGILDVVPTPVTIIKIHKTYQGQAKQIALALWGSRLSIGFTKIVMVVEEDVDIRNPREFQMALLQKVDPAKSLFILSGYPGDVIDPSMPVELKYEMGGTVQENKLLIDATTRWDEFPIREEWGNKRFPPSCTKVIPEIEELVKRRWEEYGL
jgi:4-hydroxy-3-polyprenylbenzoate decarboxylase